MMERVVWERGETVWPQSGGEERWGCSPESWSRCHTVLSCSWWTLLTDIHWTGRGLGSESPAQVHQALHWGHQWVWLEQWRTGARTPGPAPAHLSSSHWCLLTWPWDEWWPLTPGSQSPGAGEGVTWPPGYSALPTLTTPSSPLTPAWTLTSCRRLRNHQLHCYHQHTNTESLAWEQNTLCIQHSAELPQEIWKHTQQYHDCSVESDLTCSGPPPGDRQCQDHDSESPGQSSTSWVSSPECDQHQPGTCQHLWPDSETTRSTGAVSHMVAVETQETQKTQVTSVCWEEETWDDADTETTVDRDHWSETAQGWCRRPECQDKHPSSPGAEILSSLWTGDAEWRESVAAQKNLELNLSVSTLNDIFTTFVLRLWMKQVARAV